MRKRITRAIQGTDSVKTYEWETESGLPAVLPADAVERKQWLDNAMRKYAEFQAIVSLFANDYPAELGAYIPAVLSESLQKHFESTIGYTPNEVEEYFLQVQEGYRLWRGTKR